MKNPRNYSKITISLIIISDQVIIFMIKKYFLINSFFSKAFLYILPRYLKVKVFIMKNFFLEIS